MDKVEEMRRKLISAAKRKVQEKYEAKDVHIIKSVNLLEDLDSVANLLTEQLREWYSVHFPELNEIVPDQKEYLALCHYIGERGNFTAEKVLEHLNNKEDRDTADKIVSAAKSSIGSDVSPDDLDEMRSVALNCLNIIEEREAISKYLEQAMQKELPNFTALAGATIGAKMLAKIGSKKKLAFVPASTLQIVGAEKALFLHFRIGVKGPKHGYLYQHPLVKAASHENKGRMARTIAAKLSIAAKMDYFGSTGNAEDMKKQLEKRAKELSERKHKEKPAKKEEPPMHTQTPERPRDSDSKLSGQAPRPPFRKHWQERKSGFERHNDRPGFRPRRTFDRGPGGEGGWHRGFGMERREGAGRHGGGFRGRHENAQRRPWKGGKQKRDYHSTERRKFEQESAPQKNSRGPRHGHFEKPRHDRPSGKPFHERQGKPFHGHPEKPRIHGGSHGHRKFGRPGKNRGDVARKRF